MSGFPGSFHPIALNPKRFARNLGGTGVVGVGCRVSGVGCKPCVTTRFEVVLVLGDRRH